MSTLRPLLSAAMLCIVASLISRSAAAAAGPVTPVWQEVAPGVWKTTVGRPESLTLLKAAGGKPALDALARMPAAPFPFDATQIEGRQFDWKTIVRLPLGAEEDIYGLGVDFSSMRRNGNIFELRVDHWSTRVPVTGRTHAPVPLYVSTQGFAVLFDTARYLKVTVGHGVRLAAPSKPPVIDRTTGTVWQEDPQAAPVRGRWNSAPRSDSIEVLANAEGMDVYVFAGPSPLDAIRRYNLYAGGGALPPKWGLGFMARTPTRYGAKEALETILDFRRNGIPLDMLGLEPGWMSYAYPCSFEWDATRFPDPEGFLAEVRKHNVRVNLWFNPYVGPPSTPLYQKLLPYAGTHLVWNGIVPDYTLEEPKRIFIDHLKRTVIEKNPSAIGGFKLDEVDGYDRYLWPDTATFPSGLHSEQLRQTYAMLLQQAVYASFHESDRRTMSQIRGNNAGASPYPFVIYSDSYDFDEYITAVCNSGFAGVLWSPEVRGNGGLETRLRAARESGRTDEAQAILAEVVSDQVRRTQAVCFSPLALFNGWATSTKLWTYPEATPHVRSAILLRQRLLPYLYHSFAQYHREGTPVIRPMQLASRERPVRREGTAAGELEATANPYEVPAAARETKDQYLFGDALLVAPIAPGATSRTVLLPEGKWYDFYTGRYAGADETITVTPPLDRIPLFVRDGALVPMIAVERPHAPQAGERLPLEIRHYGEKPGALSLYDDDGETFAYERGEYSYTGLGVVKDAAGRWQGSVTPDANGRPWSYSDVTWTFMTP